LDLYPARPLDKFLNELDGSTPLLNGGASPTAGADPRPDPFHQLRNHKFLLAQKALVTVYGPTGPNLGETEKDCVHKVNEWLRHNGKHVVSKQTIRRAKRQLRDGH
jgi:hypothetical protein